MGNTCATLWKDGLFQTISNTICWSRTAEVANEEKKQIGNEADQSESKEAEGASVQNQPPEEMKIVKEETGKEQQGKSREETQRQQSKCHLQRLNSKPSHLASYNKGETKVEPGKPRKPHNVKRQSCAGLQVESVLQTKTGHLKEYYNLGKKVGHG